MPKHLNETLPLERKKSKIFIFLGKFSVVLVKDRDRDIRTKPVRLCFPFSSSLLFPCQSFISSFIFLSHSRLHICGAADVHAAHPEEDVLGGVEACGVDPCGVRRRALAHDAAGETGNGALD